jgi:hypothetical protein
MERGRKSLFQLERAKDHFSGCLACLHGAEIKDMNIVTILNRENDINERQE